MDPATEEATEVREKRRLWVERRLKPEQWRWLSVKGGGDSGRLSREASDSEMFQVAVRPVEADGSGGSRESRAERFNGSRDDAVGSKQKRAISPAASNRRAECCRAGAADAVRL
jgi:hypothetical protein